LDTVYRESQALLQGKNSGALQLDDLVRVTGMNETRLRVALSILEEAGLTVRTYDPPNPFRSLLLEIVNPAPPGALEGAAALLERMRAIREQQIADVVNYSLTVKCRHGYLQRHLGGRPLQRCSSCDNCGAECVPEVADTTPSEEEQRLVILRTLKARSMGMVNLVKVVHGQRTVDAALLALPTFGALSYRSQTEIKNLVEKMVDEGLVYKDEFKPGMFALKLTAAGRRRVEEVDARPA
jgi:hypothetical protein